jgi:hypothetical protein
MEARAAFWTLIIAPWKKPKKIAKTYSPGMVIPNQVKIVTLFIIAKGTRTLKLHISDSSYAIEVTVQIGRLQILE